MNTTITSRPAETEADYWAIYRLLIDTVPTLPLGLNWDMRRWEGRRFYDARPTGDPNWHNGVQMWHTAVGALAGVVIADASGWIWPQVHPDYRHLETEMVAWAEANLAVVGKEGNGRSFHIPAFDYDTEQQALLAARAMATPAVAESPVRKVPQIRSVATIRHVQSRSVARLVNS